MRKTLEKMLICALLVGSSEAVMAAEGGSGVYPLGLMGPQAGMVPPPGTYFTDYVYAYSGSASASVSANRQVPVPGTNFKIPASATGRVDVDVDVLANIAMLTHFLKDPVLGGQLGFAVAVPYSSVDLSVSGSGVASIVGPGGRSLELPGAGQASRSLDGIGDTTVTAILGWRDGYLHYSAILNGYLPTGRYDANRPVNTGRNHSAIEPMGAITYLDEQNGRELSAAAGLTINQENPDTDYETGLEFHLEAAAIQHFSKFFYVGLGGYLYHQVTGDSGDGASGDFKGRVYGAGPVIGGAIPLSEDRQLMLGLRYYEEWGAENRLEGRTIFFNVALQL